MAAPKTHNRENTDCVFFQKEPSMFFYWFYFFKMWYVSTQFDDQMANVWKLGFKFLLIPVQFDSISYYLCYLLFSIP